MAFFFKNALWEDFYDIANRERWGDQEENLIK